jgi:hypothetical protein
MEEKAKVSNPAPLGLLGFGMTTILLNLKNAGVVDLSVMILAMGLALGGLAQIFAGLMSFKQGNTFGGTAFTAYGLFWWSLVLIWWNPFGVANADDISMGWYLLVWGVFTAFMFVGALKHNNTTKVVFGALATLFFVLAIGDFAGSNPVIIAAGIIGIFTGLAAFYSAVAQIVNEEFKKKIFPL